MALFALDHQLAAAVLAVIAKPGWLAAFRAVDLK